jgi:hypothetical protein
MRSVLRSVTVTFLLVSIAACGGKASEDQCTDAVDNMIQILAVAPPPPGTQPPPPPAPGSSAAKQLEAAQKKFRDTSSGRTALIESCTKSWSSDRASCVLSAVDEVSLAKCGEE